MQRTLGRYHILRQIARSTMSTIYLARSGVESATGPIVAIKTLRESLLRGGDEFLRRFENEALIGSAIEHPNVVAVLEHGSVDGQPFIVMEHLEGVNLAELMEISAEDEALPVAFWAHLCARAADGLHAIHELRPPEELVHHDVSPKNIVVTISGEVKLLDLGLVRPAGPPPGAEREGQLAGTYAYLAPERVERRHTDRRADIFSLGVVLFEATTLTRLFKGRTDEETLENIRRYRLRPPHVVVPHIPRRLEAIVMRALRREPAGRYSTAVEMAAALDEFVLSPEGGAWDRGELVDVISERLLSLIDTSVS